LQQHDTAEEIIEMTGREGKRPSTIAAMFSITAIYDEHVGYAFA
jgi:hypothetical protein